MQEDLYRIGVVVLVVLCALLITILALKAAPLEITINENNRYYRNTGTITLYDPFVEGKILGSYRFVTGGAGRGPLPFGKYEIGSYRDDPGTSFTRDSQRFRRRWMLRQPGLNDGEAVGGWSELELHSIHSSGRTAGCIGVLGSLEVWDDFVSKMNYIISTIGDIAFDISPNPEGGPGETYMVSRHRPHHDNKKVAWHRHKSKKHIKIAGKKSHRKSKTKRRRA